MHAQHVLTRIFLAYVILWICLTHACTQTCTENHTQTVLITCLSRPAADTPTILSVCHMCVHRLYCISVWGGVCCGHMLQVITEWHWGSSSKTEMRWDECHHGRKVGKQLCVLAAVIISGFAYPVPAFSCSSPIYFFQNVLFNISCLFYFCG